MKDDYERSHINNKHLKHIFKCRKSRACLQTICLMELIFKAQRTIYINFVKKKTHSMLINMKKRKNDVVGQALWELGRQSPALWSSWGERSFTLHCSQTYKAPEVIAPPGPPSKSTSNVALKSPLSPCVSLSHRLLIAMAAMWTPFPTVKYKALSSLNEFQHFGRN